MTTILTTILTTGPFRSPEPSSPSPPRRPRGALLLLTLIAFGWRVQGLDRQSLWRDEVDAVYFALRELPETLAMFVQAGQNGALYFLALRPWLSWLGSSEFALRYPSVLFGTLTVPVLWLVACRLVPTGDPQRERSEEPALWRFQPGDAPLLTALLFALNPYQLWYSQEGKMYALVTLLATLAVLFLIQAIERNRGAQWWALLVTVSVAIYIHLLMILLIPMLVVLFLIAWPQSRSRWRNMLLVLGGLTLPYIPMLIWQWELLLSAEKMTGFNRTPFTDAIVQIVLNQTRGFMPPGALLWLAPFFALALAGLAIGFLEIRPATSATTEPWAPWRRYLWVVAWLLTPILAIQLLSLRQPIFTPRYVIWIAPAAMMLLALGIQLVRSSTGRAAAALSLLLVSYLCAFWLYAGWQQKSNPIKYDLRSAVTLIAAQRAPQTLLLLQIPHLEWAYRYYSSDRGRTPFAGSDERLGDWAAGLWTNNGLPDEEAATDVARQMMSLTAGRDELWLLSSEVEMWDARQLMRQWLDANAVIVEAHEYHGAQVHRYRLTE